MKPYTAVADARLLEIDEGARLDVERFAAWLTAVEPTRQRVACWTALGLEYTGVDAAWAREKGLEGWS